MNKRSEQKFIIKDFLPGFPRARSEMGVQANLQYGDCGKDKTHKANDIGDRLQHHMRDGYLCEICHCPPIFINHSNKSYGNICT